MTDGIRVCQRSDFEEIADLYRSTFQNSAVSQSSTLQQYLEQVYLDNPWATEIASPLVSQKSGRIDGFLGVVPQKLHFQGEQITMAASSALMVAQDEAGNRNPITGVGLLRTFLDGKQDLSLTDTANDITCRIWTASGGSIAHPYCYTWLRPLKPLATCADVLLGSGRLQSLVSPLLSLCDSVLKRMPPIKPQSVDCEVVEISTMELLKLQQRVKNRAVLPCHDLSSMEWLIEMAEQSDEEGPLAKCVVRSKGVELGWFVYYRSRNAVGRVLQLVGFGNSYDAVLDCLIHDASQHGVAALWGRTEPGKNTTLTSRRCVFKGAPWVLVHSKRQEIIEAFQKADALFTGFEGEHWMKTNA